MAHTMDRWVGKVAVVTGASAGIGAAICDSLVEHGVIVAGLARRAETVEANAKKLSGKKGKLYAVKADISKEEDILNAFKWITEELGPVSILINNAGIVIDVSLSEGTLEDWKAVFDVNVFGLCVATREAIKSMKANNINGQIIHINSVAGHKIVAGAQSNVYPASKHAVTALAETLRLELAGLGSKIKVTSLSPGLVASPNKTRSAKTMEFIKNSPMLEPSDIAGGVIYVLSTPPNVNVQELTIKPVGELF